MTEDQSSGKESPDTPKRFQSDIYRQHYVGTGLAKRGMTKDTSREEDEKEESPGGDEPLEEMSPLELVKCWFRFLRKPSNANSAIATFTAIAALSGILFGIFHSWQSSDVLNATIEQFHLDQRAWISAEPVVVRFVEKERIQLEVRIHNTGKTPAINTRICTYANNTFPDGGRDHPYPCNYEPVLRLHPIMPNETVPQPLGTPFEVFVGEKDKYVNPFSQEKLKLFASGEFWYQDVFGCEHWVKFCRQYDGPNDRFVSCFRKEQDAEMDDVNTCTEPTKLP